MHTNIGKYIPQSTLVLISSKRYSLYVKIEHSNLTSKMYTKRDNSKIILNQNLRYLRVLQFAELQFRSNTLDKYYI